MARHEFFDFELDGFQRFIPSRFRHTAERLEEVYHAFSDRLSTGRASIRETRSQYVHYVDLKGSLDHRIAVFSVHANRGFIELYHPGALTRKTRELCSHTRSGRDWAVIVLPEPNAIDRAVKGHMSVAEAKRIIEEYLNSLDRLVSARVATPSSSEGELIVFRALGSDVSNWHIHARPDFIHQSSQRKLELDFWCPSRNFAIEVMGVQHFKSVDLWGGDVTRMGGNQRTLMKVKACMQKKVALVFARWDRDTILARANENEIIERIQQAYKIALATNRWVDIDETLERHRFDGYDFLRMAGLASGLD